MVVVVVVTTMVVMTLTLVVVMVTMTMVVLVVMTVLVVVMTVLVGGGDDSGGDNDSVCDDDSVCGGGGGDDSAGGGVGDDSTGGGGDVQRHDTPISAESHNQEHHLHFLLPGPEGRAVLELAECSDRPTHSRDVLGSFPLVILGEGKQENGRECFSVTQHLCLGQFPGGIVNGSSSILKDLCKKGI